MNKILNVIKFKDADLYSVTLPVSGLYLIDNKPVYGLYNQKVQVIDVNNIIPITRTRVVVHYLNSSETISTEEYIDQKENLLKQRILNNNDDVYEWNSLEDEYNYKKFIQVWTPVHKEVEIQGDPFTVAINESVIDTKNPFISSEYINGGSNPLLFTYNRHNALLKIVSDKFNELGMTFADDINYSATTGVKKWGNSTHSCIQYVTAFGKYIFSNKFKTTQTFVRGELSTLLDYYEKDKAEIEEIIQLEYNTHFGNVDINKFDFGLVLSELRSVKNLLSSVNTKNKTESYLYSALGKIYQLIKIIQKSHVVQSEKSK